MLYEGLLCHSRAWLEGQLVKVELSCEFGHLETQYMQHKYFGNMNKHEREVYFDLGDGLGWGPQACMGLTLAFAIGTIYISCSWDQSKLHGLRGWCDAIIRRCLVFRVLFSVFVCAFVPGCLCRELEGARGANPKTHVRSRPIWVWSGIMTPSRFAF